MNALHCNGALQIDNFWLTPASWHSVSWVFSSNINHCTLNDYAEIHLSYVVMGKSSRRITKMYADFYLKWRKPQHKIFAGVHEQLKENWKRSLFSILLIVECEISTCCFSTDYNIASSTCTGTQLKISWKLTSVFNTINFLTNKNAP